MKQAQPIFARFDPNSEFFRVHVKPYSRAGPAGATVQVGAYDDKRQAARPNAPAAPSAAPRGGPTGAPRPTQPRAGGAATGAFPRPMGMAPRQPTALAQPGPGPQNPWAEHGKKLYVLSGRDEYLHSDNSGKSWARSSVEGANLRDDAHRQQVRAHLESHGYKNPPLTPDLLPHVHGARSSAVEHPGHFEGGLEEATFRRRQQQALKHHEEREAETRERPPAAPAPADPEAKPWKPPEDRGEHAKLLGSAEVEAGRPLGSGVTGAHLLKLKDDGRGIFKAGGAREPNVRFDSIPHGTYHKREVAAHELDKLLGTGMVPPTVAREHDGEQGSMQAWLEGAQEGRGAKHLADNPGMQEQLHRMAVLDAAMGHSDRHGGNYVLSPEGQVHAIDNGISFAYGFEGVGKNHEVIRDAKKPIRVPPDLRQRMGELSLGEVENSIGKHVEPWAVAQTFARMRYLADKGSFTGDDLTSQKLFSYAREKLPHVYDRMIGGWDNWGPEPPGWKEITEQKWPPPGKPGHEYAMRESIEQARKGVRSESTAPSKPKRAPAAAAPAIAK